MSIPKISAVLLLLTMVVEGASAQIKIIPRQRVDSIANIASVANSPMRFTEGKHIRFDTIAEECSVWQRVVEWHNVGDRPIVVNEIKSSCGCLRGQSDRRVVRQGEKAHIILKYYPKGHPGHVSQRLFIFTSVDERKPTAVLNLSGYVKISSDRVGDYPTSRGELLLRREYVALDGSGIYRVACYNAGSKTLHLSADTLLSARGVKMYTEPEMLAPKSEGDLVITCDEQLLKDGDKLYIKGLQLPLRERAIVMQKSSEKE